ncbi:MAG TPA: hypothetical protein O0X63_05130, partial [Methanocorpusculum sp.]|nr:hypothetical protein [Methanocorpusculum sp.]
RELLPQPLWRCFGLGFANMIWLPQSGGTQQFATNGSESDWSLSAWSAFFSEHTRHPVMFIHWIRADSRLN